MFKGKQCIDLTHPLSSTTPTWNGKCGFSATVKIDYDEGLRAQSLRMHAGIGTHMDAPAHFIQGGKTIGEIALEELLVPLITCDVSSFIKNPHDQITLDFLKIFEETWGLEAHSFKGAFFACYTGWSKHWSISDAYRNVGSDGHMRFPTYHVDTAEYLVKKGIIGLGIDTLSPDLDPALTATPFPVHYCVLRQGCYILENLANLDLLPVQSWMINLPLYGKEMTESPSRVVAIF